MTTSVSNIIRRDAKIYWKSHLPVPVEVTWNDVWRTVTPLAVFGCYLMVSTWRRRGFARAAVVALISMIVFGILARPAYAVGSLLNSQDLAARQWLASFNAALSGEPGAWYPPSREEPPCAL
jgi:hypothetical protein